MGAREDRGIVHPYQIQRYMEHRVGGTLVDASGNAVTGTTPGRASAKVGPRARPGQKRQKGVKEQYGPQAANPGQAMAGGPSTA